MSKVFGTVHPVQYRVEARFICLYCDGEFDSGWFMVDHSSSVCRDLSKAQQRMQEYLNRPAGYDKRRFARIIAVTDSVLEEQERQFPNYM